MTPTLFAPILGAACLAASSLAGAGDTGEGTSPRLESDHREAPFIQEDPAADLADVYAFLSPGGPDNLVLALTVNPLAAAGEAVSYHFSPNVFYSFLIDNTGDAIEDHRITVTFGEHSLGADQTMQVDFDGQVTVSGLTTEPTEEPVPNSAVVNTTAFGASFFAGPREDPFYFDVPGFFRTLAGTGSFSGNDTFAGLNVSAIVVQIPLSFVSPNGEELQIWAETHRRARTIRRSSTGQLQIETGQPEQVDRVGNPAVATALISPGMKDFYNINHPKDDPVLFAGDIVANLQALGTTQANIDVLAAIAVPDTLKLDPAVPTVYPNGRGLDDDVIDTLFDLIFNQTGVTDMVDANDVPSTTNFPYIGAPHQPQ